MKRRIVIPAGLGSVDLLARSQVRVLGRKARGTLTVSKSPDLEVTLGPVRGIVTTADNQVFDLFENRWWRRMLWGLDDWFGHVFWRIQRICTEMKVDIDPRSRHTIVGVLEAASRDDDGDP